MLEEGVRRGDTITVQAECEVEYDGRAASSLPPGDRHVMLKTDGTTLVREDDAAHLERVSATDRDADTSDAGGDA